MAAHELELRVQIAGTVMYNTCKYLEEMKLKEKTIKRS